MDGNELFPVFIKLNAIHTVVIGAGPVGLEKLAALLNNSPEARISVIALKVIPELRVYIHDFPSITLYEKAYEEADLDEASLVIAATNNDALNQQIRTDAKKRNLLVNFADKPSLCDFYLGSIVKKGDLKIAISTNGKSPTVAKRLKEILNESLPPELDTTLQQMSELRNKLGGDFAYKVKKLNQLTSLLIENKEEKVENNPMKTQLTELAAQIKDKDPVAVMRYFAETYPDMVTFSTSFGWEDQVVTDLIFKNDIPVKVFTLETGRLFPETYYVWNRTLEIYQKSIKAYFPDTEAIQQLVQEKGPNSFYESVENRKTCCYIRKIEPLKRALKGNKIWITGIRAEQSVNRHDMSNLEWDEQNQLLKYHPLFDWSLEMVKAYVKEHNVVYNTLHDRGFPSIGCAPCTRAVQEGEDFRAGRWWWEDQSKKECGLHATS